MRLVALVVLLCACGGGRPPAPYLFPPPSADQIQIDFAALEAGPFRFKFDERTITPKVDRDLLPNGTLLVSGTFGKTGSLVFARVGSTMTGVVREGSIGFEIVPFPGGHRIVPRSWQPPLRPRHGPNWDQTISAARGPAPTTLVLAELVTIDILFAYTPAVLKQRPLDGITGLVATAIKDLNAACAKRCPRVLFRDAGVVPTAGTETAADGTKKDMYTLYYELLVQSHFKDAHAARKTAKADILVLLVDSAHGALGYGTIMGKPNTAVAVADHHDSLWYLTIPHEVGHVMGGLHDDDVREDPFKFGHAYSVVGNSRTIMSNPCSKPKECPLVKQWSEKPLGDVGWRDNARVMRTTAAAVSKFGDQIP